MFGSYSVEDTDGVLTQNASSKTAFSVEHNLEI